jgi:hypothetical protein
MKLTEAAVTEVSSLERARRIRGNKRCSIVAVDEYSLFAFGSAG